MNKLSSILPLVEHCSTNLPLNAQQSIYPVGDEDVERILWAEFWWRYLLIGHGKRQKKEEECYHEKLHAWYWTSMCLVRRWNSGFLMRRKALWLFVNRGVGEIGAFPRLVSKRLCQIISLVVEEVDRYSASVVLLAQLACFPGSPKNGTMIHEKYETCAWFPVVKIHGEIGITVSGEGDGMIVPGEGKTKIQSASKIFENAA